MCPLTPLALVARGVALDGGERRDNIHPGDGGNSRILEDDKTRSPRRKPDSCSER